MHTHPFIKLALVLTLSVASSALAQATPLSTATGSPEIASALSALQNGQAQQAAQQFEALVAQPAHAGDPRLWFALAQARVQSEENQAALQAIDKAIELGGRHSDYLVLGCAAAMGDSQWSLATAYGIPALQDPQVDQSAYFMLLIAYTQLQKPIEAAKVFDIWSQRRTGIKTDAQAWATGVMDKARQMELVRKALHETDRQIADESLPSPMPRDSMGRLLNAPTVAAK